MVNPRPRDSGTPIVSPPNPLQWSVILRAGLTNEAIEDTITSMLKMIDDYVSPETPSTPPSKLLAKLNFNNNTFVCLSVPATNAELRAALETCDNDLIGMLTAHENVLQVDPGAGRLYSQCATPDDNDTAGNMSSGKDRQGSMGTADSPASDRPEIIGIFNSPMLDPSWQQTHSGTPESFPPRPIHWSFILRADLTNEETDDTINSILNTINEYVSPKPLPQQSENAPTTPSAEESVLLARVKFNSTIVYMSVPAPTELRAALETCDNDLYRTLEANENVLRIDPGAGRLYSPCALPVNTPPVEIKSAQHAPS
ncbi:hypothetical protein LTR08_007959 [Meristemomyces frigidus]|nr:hypothetical protein LTR08_007959 [Meristemomyces frigidus]